MTAISGAKFWSGFAAGALSSIASSAFRFDGNGSTEGLGLANSFRDSGAGMIAFGTVSGGAGAAFIGGNFWQGAVTGLVVSGLNHFGHKMDSEVDILEDSEGASGKGHMAVGAGNDKKGWKYVSKYAKTDSNGNLDGGIVSGGKSSAVLNEYSTRSEMLSANPEYEKVIRLKTTYRTAMKVLNGTYKAALEGYHFMMSNCAHAVGAGLNSAGIFSGSSMVPNTRYLEISKHYYPWSNPNSGAGGSW